MVRKVRFTLCVAVLFLLQVTVMHRFTYGILRPDLLYLAVIFLALEAGFAGALAGAFALGLLHDLASAGGFGASALLFLPASAALVLMRGHLLRESLMTDMVLAFFYVLACGLASAVGVAAFTSGGRIAELAPLALGQAIFTAALSPLVFAAFVGMRLVDKSSGALDAA